MFGLNPNRLFRHALPWAIFLAGAQVLSAGAYYPMYAVTFGGLNWSIPIGQVAYFGVGGVPIGSNTLALSVSLYNDSTQFDPFLFLTGSPWTPKFQDASDSIANFSGVTALNFSISSASAGVILQFPLPTANLNQAAGAARTNASVVEGSFAGSPSVPYIVGEDFQLSTTTAYVIDSLTVWAIANSPTSPGPIDTLGQEFSSFSLYTGYTADSGTTWHQVSQYNLNSTQLNAAPRAYYTGTTDYETLNPASVPEPSTFGFLGLGIAALALKLRRRR